MPPSGTPTQRRAHAQLAAHSRWAKVTDRAGAMAPARRGLEAKWVREVDPDGTLDPEELERRIRSCWQAHMARMRLAKAKRANQGR